MAHKLILFIVVLLTLTNCKQSNTADTALVVPQKSMIDTIKIELAKNLKRKLSLTPPAQENVQNWSAYNTIANNLDSLSQPTIAELKRIIPTMIAAFENTEEAETANVSIKPDTLDFMPINARVLTVETQIRILKDLIKKRVIDHNRVTQELTKLHNTFQELNLQINQRFAKSIDEILEEFDEEQNNNTNFNLAPNTPRGKPKPTLYKPNNPEPNATRLRKTER